MARLNLIARTSANIGYQGPAFALLDYDTKGMPPAVAAQLKQLGGFWPALLSALPALGDVGRVTRRSTSSGLSRTDTGRKVAGSDGIHLYIKVDDGDDVERFLRALHDRCWMAGLGWCMVSASGALLERSIVDRMVSGAERLVFEGGPILTPPLKQDKKSRRPIAVDGDVLDTVAACPPLSIVEAAQAARAEGAGGATACARSGKGPLEIHRRASKEPRRADRQTGAGRAQDYRTAVRGRAAS